MNVHPAIKIIRANYTPHGIKYSYVNIEKIKKETQITEEELIEFRVWLKEKELANKRKIE